jgi:hypothetical protein
MESRQAIARLPVCGMTVTEIKGKGMNGKGMIMKERFPSSFLCRTFLCLQLPNAHSLPS